MEHTQSVRVEVRAAAEGTSQIIRDIDDIAFQTNLLALDAAVEAARAGEAGRVRRVRRSQGSVHPS